MLGGNFMKRIKYYTTIALLLGNFTLTGCGKTESYIPEAIKLESSMDSLTETLSKKNAEIAEHVQREEQERSEREAFNRAVIGADVIDSDTFKGVFDVTITWNNEDGLYNVELKNGETIYKLNSPAEGIVSYAIMYTNCENIHLHNIQDSSIISELSGISTLKQLSIKNSNIADFSAIGNIPSLTGLKITNCPNLTNIDFFNTLPNIEAIEILGTKATDLSPLSNCAKLERAVLRCNEFTNPSVLANLENINTVMLDYNNITDEAELTDLIARGLIEKEYAERFITPNDNQRKIYLTNDCEDTGCTLRITYLESKDQYYGRIYDKDETIVAYTLLDESFSFYDISRKFKNHVNLYLENIPEHILDINFTFSNEDEYQSVMLENSKISDLSFLCDFEGVKSLYISGCPNLVECPFTTSFEDDLEYFNELELISIQNTRISDLSLLSSAKNLKYIYLRNNDIKSYHFLTELPNLEVLDFDIDNPVNIIERQELRDLLSNGIDIRINGQSYQMANINQKSDEGINEEGPILELR